MSNRVLCLIAHNSDTEVEVERDKKVHLNIAIDNIGFAGPSTGPFRVRRLVLCGRVSRYSNNHEQPGRPYIRGCISASFPGRIDGRPHGRIVTLDLKVIGLALPWSLQMNGKAVHARFRGSVSRFRSGRWKTLRFFLPRRSCYAPSEEFQRMETNRKSATLISASRDTRSRGVVRRGASGHSRGFGDGKVKGPFFEHTKTRSR